jgi:FkbM family methyltransferase
MYGALYGAELHFAKFLIKNLGPDDVFYDVGANRGFYTFLGAELASETHSFEPMPGLADDIRASIRAEDRITINPVALSDADGSTDFFITKSTMVNTINASVAEHIATQNYYTVRKLKVPTVTLDAYVQTHAKPTIIKIDAEGAEEQILKGGFDFFASHAPIIAMEVWGKENNWELSTRAVELLARMGYRSYRLDSAGGVQEMRGDLTSHVVPAGGENFIFKK